MMFCPKCGSLLVPMDKKGKKVLGCSCGYIHKKKEEVKIKEVIKDREKDIEPIDKEIEPYPIVETECPKCHNDKAYFWTVQTRASDEPETKFYKCTKCKHVRRDYG